MPDRQAKVLNPEQVRKAVNASQTPSEKVMMLLSHKAAMRACEIASLMWEHVTDAEGNLADAIVLPNSATKAKSGGRSIPLHPELRDALAILLAVRDPDLPHVVRNRHGKAMNAGAVQMHFARRYEALGFVGASSHSGRRTAITNLARCIGANGGSLRDVQAFAGHRHLSTTQRYIDQNPAALSSAIAMI